MGAMPTVEQLEWFFKTGSVYGLGTVLLTGGVALSLWFLYRIGNGIAGLVDDIRRKWLPDIAGGHLDFLQTTAKNSDTTAKAVVKLSESTTLSTDNHGKTHRALHFIARAQQEECCDEAKQLLNDAIRELK